MHPLYYPDLQTGYYHKLFADAAEQQGGLLGDRKHLLIDWQKESSVHIGVIADRPRCNLAKTNDGVKYRHLAKLRQRTSIRKRAIISTYVYVADILRCTVQSMPDLCCAAQHSMGHVPSPLITHGFGEEA